MHSSPHSYIIRRGRTGREWKWSPPTQDRIYLKIVRVFEDTRCAPYSIQQIALMGASEGKQVGEWFGPNTVAQVFKLVRINSKWKERRFSLIRIPTILDYVFRKLAVYDEWNNIVLHVALDNSLVTNEVSKCRGLLLFGKKSGPRKFCDTGSLWLLFGFRTTVQTDVKMWSWYVRWPVQLFTDAKNWITLETSDPHYTT